MDYSSNTNGTTLSVTFRGEFTFSDNESIRLLIGEITDTECSHTSIDLSDLSSIDSAGLGMLLLINDAVQNKNNTMDLCGATGQVQKMLEISKFSEIIPVKA